MSEAARQRLFPFQNQGGAAAIMAQKGGGEGCVGVPRGGQPKQMEMLNKPKHPDAPIKMQIFSVKKGGRMPVFPLTNFDEGRVKPQIPLISQSSAPPPAPSLPPISSRKNSSSSQVGRGPSRVQPWLAACHGWHVPWLAACFSDLERALDMFRRSLARFRRDLVTWLDSLPCRAEASGHAPLRS